jgi:hypothetical protein
MPGTSTAVMHLACEFNGSFSAKWADAACCAASAPGWSSAPARLSPSLRSSSTATLPNVTFITRGTGFCGWSRLRRLVCQRGNPALSSEPVFGPSLKMCAGMSCAIGSQLRRWSGPRQYVEKERRQCVTRDFFRCPSLPMATWPCP